MYQSIRVPLKTAPELKRAILAADPSYRKREACLVITEQCRLSGTYWSGGTYHTYTAVDLATGASRGAPQYNPPQFGGPAETPVVDIPQGVAIVQTGFFCGKVATAYVHIHPLTAAPLLEAA